MSSKITQFLTGLVGASLILSLLPLGEFVQPGILAGGDNPAHLVLIDNANKAIRSLSGIPFYDFSFWMGFEAFQFYFPLPYFFGGLVTFLTGPALALKIVSLVGILLLPFSFSRLASSLGGSSKAMLAGSLLSLCFLLTDVHTMWGGNALSSFSGMFANAWGLSLGLISLSELIKLGTKQGSLLRASLLCSATALSHFYGLIVILVYTCGILFVELSKTKGLSKYSVKIVKCGFWAILVSAWWIVPLVLNRSYSSEYGSNWSISLAETLSLVEVSLAVLSFCLISISIFWTGKKDAKSDCAQLTSNQTVFLITPLFFLGLYYLGPVFGDGALLNNRLWPYLYLSIYLLYLVAIVRLEELFGYLGIALAGLSLLILSPSVSEVEKATSWASWNYSGVSRKLSGEEFLSLLAFLDTLPAGRISFESDPKNHYRLGSIRAFETIPALSKHEIIEGGIVNSAFLPGNSYFLQCLSSKTCAGWPQGSVMPKEDYVEAVAYAKRIGVNYHIASTERAKKELNQVAGLRVIWRGESFNVLEIEDSSLVDVYEQKLPVLEVRNRQLFSLNWPRLRSLRERGLILAPLKEEIIQGREYLRYSGLVDTLLVETINERLTQARSFKENDNLFSLNLWYLSKEDSEFGDLTKGDLYFGKKPFDLSSYFHSPETQFGHLRFFSDDPSWSFKTTGLKREHSVSNPSFVLDENETEFYEIGAQQTNSKFIDSIRSKVEKSSSHLNLLLAKKSSRPCNPKLLKSANRIELETKCIGFDHEIKYNWAKKWQVESGEASVFMTAQGFLGVHPRSEKVTLVYKRNVTELISVLVSIVGLLLLVVFRKR